MHDCDNAEMKDRLPDLLHGAGGPELAPARAHVARCESCASELAFLRAVRAASGAARVDVARIAAAIPPYRRRSRWERTATAPALRTAAAIVLALGLGTVALVSDQRRAGRDTANAVVAAAAPRELDVGTPLADLTESDLQDLLDDLGELEAVTPAEADVVVIPALDRNGA